MRFQNQRKKHLLNRWNTKQYCFCVFRRNQNEKKCQVMKTFPIVLFPKKISQKIKQKVRFLVLRWLLRYEFFKGGFDFLSGRLGSPRNAFLTSMIRWLAKIRIFLNFSIFLSRSIAKSIFSNPERCESLKKTFSVGIWTCTNRHGFFFWGRNIFFGVGTHVPTPIKLFLPQSSYPKKNVPTPMFLPHVPTQEHGVGTLG